MSNWTCPVCGERDPDLAEEYERYWVESQGFDEDDGTFVIGGCILVAVVASAWFAAGLAVGVWLL